MALTCLMLAAAPTRAAETRRSTSPQGYRVHRNDADGRLSLSTPYYTVEHDLRQGGAIAGVRLTYGNASNLLAQPIAAWIRDADGVVFSERQDPKSRVSHQRTGSVEVVTVEGRLLDGQGRVAPVEVRTRFEYHWGYVKVRKEFAVTAGAPRVRELCVLSTTLDPALAHYGYREGTTEYDGAPPFAFGSFRWGRLRVQNPADAPIKAPFLPRSMLFADPGVEGLEWFVGSDLAQWDLQLTGRRGQGACDFVPASNPAGLALTISPFRSETNAVALPGTCRFDYYLGVPLLEGHALKPWFHTSFNRNRGEWVSADQIRKWAETGIQTVHCHNDGDYYDDGLFWRDGSYPPYPDMNRYDQVIDGCHQAGIRVATYFSNKELHPSTREFQEHGTTWGRTDLKGRLQRNIYRGTNEFGAQMCLRSGWADFLRFSIDRVLKNHRLDGVYYDWNVALPCYNPLHEGKAAGAVAHGHWDIDELLHLMEWTRQRVGPDGLVIVHNTTTPMFVMENFADYIVANEWGYGKWQEPGPALDDLPLEWTLVGARARGVISYGQLDAQSPRRLHRVFALEALLGGVTPWPASPETFEIFPALKPLGDLEQYRFADWRNAAVTLEGTRCGSAVYSRPGEAWILLANLEKTPQQVRCTLKPARLPYPMTEPRQATLVNPYPATADGSTAPANTELDARQLVREGVTIPIAADGVVLLRLR